jgi:flavodoxin I
MTAHPKIAIIYASGMGRTQLMAEAIAEGARTVNGIDILLKDVSLAVPEDIKDASAILLGGSTYNHKLIGSMRSFLDRIKDIDLKGKVGVAFGSYGWSGEGVPAIMDWMKSKGMNPVEPSLSVHQLPNEKVIQDFFMLGQVVAEGTKG